MLEANYWQPKAKRDAAAADPNAPAKVLNKLKAVARDHSDDVYGYAGEHGYTLRTKARGWQVSVRVSRSQQSVEVTLRMGRYDDADDEQAKYHEAKLAEAQAYLKPTLEVLAEHEPWPVDKAFVLR